MAVIKFFANLRRVAGTRETEVDEPTVREVIETLCASTPGLEQAIFDEHGNVHPHVRIMLNGHDVALGRGLDTPVSTNDEIAIFPPIGGGMED